MKVVIGFIAALGSVGSSVKEQRIPSMNVLIVEADTLFEGHKRVRVPKDATFDEIEAVLTKQLGVNGKEWTMSIYESNSQSIVPWTRDQLIRSHTRVFLDPKQQSKNEILAIATRQFDYAFDQGEFKIHGMPLYIKEVGNTGKGTGLTIWDGSVVLARYLEDVSTIDGHEDNINGLRAIELGAGTGLVGLAAAFCGASHVTLTDLPYTLMNIDTNIQANKVIKVGSVVTHELDWFSTTPSPSLHVDQVDVLLGSDIVWVESLIAPLVKTISTLLRIPPKSASRYMLLSHQTRSTASDTIFFDLLGKHGLKWKVVESTISTDKIHLYRITS